MTKQGNLTVHTENIFPIIKKFLYSDHEIFLRELISNAVDATQKLKTLASSGEFDGELGDLKIKIEIDSKKKTLKISDHGIGMTEAEVDQYINQIAFSSAEEFVQKFADTKDAAAIIGHFGLGFYSAFMVAEKVEIQTKSYKKENADPVHWTCIGTTSFEMDKGKRKTRGTDIILHINDDSSEFLETSRIETMLKKYCRFMPVEIEFDGKTINNTEPLWLKKPNVLKDEDYIAFYKELYPYSEDPLFWIHLNVDYPFNLTGILYFPRHQNYMEVQKNKVQLYSNQVFVTDEVKEIMPEFLTLLHGIVDSPDIPLNVSRSYLQADSNVKKISSYIVKKVSDKLADIFKENREDFEKKWDEIGFFIKYGMLTDEKFAEKAREFALVKNTESKYFTFAEYIEKVKPLQTDKNGTEVWLYTTDEQQQHSFIDAVKKKSYDVLVLNNPIDSHFIQHIESKEEKLAIKRVDADTPDKLIEKEDKVASVLNKDEETALQQAFENIAGKDKYTVKLESLSPDDAPALITQSEWMRRMKEMSRLSGNNSMDMFPGGYDLILNTNHKLSKKIADGKGDEESAKLAGYLFDLARLSQNLLSGQDLTDFVNRSIEQLNS